MKVPRLLLAVWTASLLILQPESTHGVTINWTTVGDPENVADDTGYGAVGYEYRIGKYEVTIQEYAEFLNAVAKSDPYSLYNASMGTSLNIAGISRQGSSGAYTYSVVGPSGATTTGASSPGNRPITYVSWWDAARFANWMQNGQLSGTAGAASTETGAYSLNGATSGAAVSKNPGAQFYIPNEEEWYKAAYYKGGSANAGYWDYATRSDTAPGNAIGSLTNQANFKTELWTVTQTNGYSAAQNYLTDVGAFAGSASFYGTVDQGGNVYEWGSVSGSPGSLPWLRGGSWQYGGTDLRSDYRLTNDASLEGIDVGFRLAAPAPVPEPSTWAMALAGLACCVWQFKRRQRRLGPGCPSFSIAATCLALAASSTNVLGAPVYLADNITAVFANGIGVTNTNWLAQGFSTTSDSYVITSITVPVAQFNVTSGTLGLYIYDATGENGRPGSQIGSEVGTIDYSLLPAVPTFQNISFGSTVSIDRTLAPSTTYFLVLKGLGMVGDEFQWGYTASDSGIGFPSAYTYTDDAGAIWALPDNTQPQQMRIEAIVVPEPTTWILALAGLGVAGRSIWRRTGCRRRPDAAGLDRESASAADRSCAA